MKGTSAEPKKPYRPRRFLPDRGSRRLYAFCVVG
jgi:hypothetical protein